MAVSAKVPGKLATSGGIKNMLFWSMAHNLASQTEHERITRISSGFEPAWLTAVKGAFNLTLPALAILANVSNSTVERRIKSKEPLDSVVSERIDRLALVAVLAEEVFEDKTVAGDWMSAPNDALGGKSPLSLCETELGARQVRRVLHAIEWGGVA
ncbi:MAG: type II toxin-antitoxin system Xre/ParS family antitoxin [Pseudomonas sp.]